MYSEYPLKREINIKIEFDEIGMFPRLRLLFDLDLSLYPPSNTFHILRPAKAPGFAYAWLELVSHRVFIGRMLAITPQQRVGDTSSYGVNIDGGWTLGLLLFSPHTSPDNDTFIYQHVSANCGV